VGAEAGGSARYRSHASAYRRTDTRTTPAPCDRTNHSPRARAIALEDLGSLALKGLTQPVSAFNVPLAATPPALRVIEGGHRAFDCGRCTPSPSNPPTAEMGHELPLP
jgi:hypothetical protein